MGLDNALWLVRNETTRIRGYTALFSFFFFFFKQEQARDLTLYILGRSSVFIIPSLVTGSVVFGQYLYIFNMYCAQNIEPFA